MLTPGLVSALAWIAATLPRSPPRAVSVIQQRPLFIFTDGAAEGTDVQVCTVGGVLVANGHPTRYFSETVPAEVCLAWTFFSLQVIAETEALAVSSQNLCGLSCAAAESSS